MSNNNSPNETAASPNWQSRIVVASSHREFMLSFGWKDGFYEGWQDALIGSGFRKQYETAPKLWQIHYEQGREVVIRLRAAGRKPNAWTNQYKPGPHLWRSVRPVFVGEA